MPRSIWSGAISFGMVNIPIKLYSAVSPKDVHFHQLHDADGVRIQQKRICPKDGKEVPYEHIAKGFEIAPNQYVLIKPEELAALDPKGTHTIDIISFADMKQIDPLYYEHAYYVVPDKGANKAYALLLVAMTESEKIAIAKVVLRTKQYTVALRPSGHALTMTTLYYADEIVSQDLLPELGDGDVKLHDKELAMARQLIGSLESDFDPNRYHDDYRERVMAMIEKKAEGQEIKAQPEYKPQTNVVNLMEALEASLAAAKKQAGVNTGSAKTGGGKPDKSKEKREMHRRGHSHKKQKTA